MALDTGRYSGVVDHENGGLLFEIEVEVTDNEGTSTFETLCDLSDVAFNYNLVAETFRTLCSAEDTITEVLARDLEISATFKYNTSNTILKSILASVFDTTGNNRLNLRITHKVSGKVIEGIWIVIPDGETYDAETVISIPVTFKTYGQQKITDWTPSP